MSYFELLSRSVRSHDRRIVYGPHPDQVIDVYDGAGPLIVLLHGGYWRAEHDRTHTRPMAAALAGEGYTVCLPEYRRAGQEGGGWPGTFDDVAAVLDAVVADPRAGEGVVLVGHSAGGHLALWSTLRHRLPAGSRWRAGPAVKGVVGLAAVSDVSEVYALGLGGGAAHALLGGRADLLDQVDPVRLLPFGDTPLVLVHGVRDRVLPVSMSRRFAAHEPRAGLVELADAGHFSLVDPFSRAWPRVLDAIASVAGTPLRRAG
ncbi:alpha/beta hydrolase [Nonomuraea sp. MG754425]|uniref:alpha/beta hydrolase family protein n=1 Tax=Nonomuraea sp. MG754425 TaxID=2570319 RepID=UPI001F312A73|nr:alpha/beta hydrolase [Nonomuraea sp. MG754425]MCF6469942.1 alpha/beta hydrolase [Nonomuraea sp. MG754425]